MNATPLASYAASGHRQRGATMLLFYFAILPTLLMGLLVLLSRVEAAQQQSLAQEARVRAELLAQSAVAVARVQSPTAPRQGTLPGMGTWSLSAADTPQSLRARGVAALIDAGNDARYEYSVLIESAGEGRWNIHTPQAVLRTAVAPQR